MIDSTDEQFEKWIEECHDKVQKAYAEIPEDDPMHPLCVLIRDWVGASFRFHKNSEFPAKEKDAVDFVIGSSIKTVLELANAINDSLSKGAQDDNPPTIG